MKHRKEMIAGVVFIPGGGWIYGDSDSYHGVTVHIASKLHVMLVSIDYRKAHEHPFPAAVDDCEKATIWFLKNAERLKVDPNRIAIVGEGSGGNLAAAITQRLRFDEKHNTLPSVKLQVLFYPMLQAFDFNTPSYQQNGKDSSLLFTRAASARSWSFYMHGNDALVEELATNNHTSSSAKTNSSASKILSHDKIKYKLKSDNYVTPLSNYGNEDTYKRIQLILENPDFNPLFCDDLSGLPQTYITVGEFDVAEKTKKDNETSFGNRQSMNDKQNPRSRPHCPHATATPIGSWALTATTTVGTAPTRPGTMESSILSMGK
ncbi:neutral cholesterol ester hydrolase 1-like [Amphiura filiformis]|uniref:neutral cholesterol ester hydrolase 1-like n=1 Tax=Amphiura filiformis TaxID=82378 RepID=UPI003B21B630